MSIFAHMLSGSVLIGNLTGADASTDTSMLGWYALVLPPFFRADDVVVVLTRLYTSTEPPTSTARTTTAAATAIPTPRPARLRRGGGGGKGARIGCGGIGGGTGNGAGVQGRWPTAGET